jgi:dolichol-phosphate mannosyltransferase
MNFSLIIPTYKEYENLKWLLPEIFKHFKENNLNGQVIVVDDNSQDGTNELLDELKKNSPLQYLSRTTERGLSSAVLAGFRLASTEILGVMDADGSHPVSALKDMIKTIEEVNVSMVIGSRFVKGGGCEGWPKHRYFISWVARMLARPLFKTKDLTSGYFFFKGSKIADLKTMQVLGFKIGLAILAKISQNEVREVPIVFTDRRYGESKLGGQQITEYINQLLEIYKERINFGNYK